MIELTANGFQVEALDAARFFAGYLLVLIAIVIVKGVALYKAARLNEKVWFWVILLLSTMGILPIIYLYIRRKRKI